MTHFVIQIRYTASIMPKGCLKGCFPVTRFSHVRRKSLNLLKFHISAINNFNKYTLNHTAKLNAGFYKFSYFISRM